MPENGPMVNGLEIGQKDRDLAIGQSRASTGPIANGRKINGLTNGMAKEVGTGRNKVKGKTPGGGSGPRVMKTAGGEVTKNGLTDILRRRRHRHDATPNLRQDTVPNHHHDVTPSHRRPGTRASNPRPAVVPNPPLVGPTPITRHRVPLITHPITRLRSTSRNSTCRRRPGPSRCKSPQSVHRRLL